MKKISIPILIKALMIFGIFALSVFCSQFSSASIESNPDVPEIISRKTWGADESLMTWPVEYAKVEKIIIHHTASTKLVADTDGSGQYKSMVNNIYKYHTSSKTWVDQNGTNYTGFGDIGYNYLIDPEGNIYEGRKGGNGSVGGHASGFNTGSVGISIIGNYQDGSAGQTNTELNPKVDAALAKLVGWIAANNGIDLNDESSFGGKTIDGVVGHKDVAATQCPGNIIYDQLGDIQSQAVLYQKAYQKYVYQVEGSKAVYVISGGYKVKFASKASLPETYQSRTVQYISKTQLDAYQYKDMIILPDGTLIQEGGEGTVYYLENSKKRALSMSESDFLTLGFKSSDVVSISSSEMDFYETGEIIKFGPEGVLIKDASNNVYLIEKGKKRLFTSATLFNYLKYSWTKVKADSEAGYYIKGENMRYPDGTLLKSKDNPSVYIMDGGKKRTFTSGALFEKLGYKWSNILAIDASEVNAYETGANVIYSNGTLIRALGTTTVYLVDNGQKREITSATLLSKLGYNFANVVEIPAVAINDYPVGAKAIYPDGTLVKAKGSSAVYRIKSGSREEFTSLNVFNAAGAKWSSVVEISSEEANLYSVSGFVKYPDGTLLRAQGMDKIYVIKNGAAVWIQTAEEFTKAGYRWSNVMVIDPAEMSLYATNDSISNSGNNGSDQNPNQDTGQTGDNTAATGTEPNIRIAIAGKYANGCLLKSSTDGKIYVIQNGQAVLINSSEEFTNAGYNWDNVVTINAKEMAVVTSSNAENTKITANGNYKVEYHRANGDIYKTVQKKSGELTEVPFFDWDNYIRFIPESDSVILQVLSYNDAYQSSTTTYNDNQFRGVIELKYSPTSKKLWVIEDVPLEGYLRGISEATTRTNTEYLKAFSVITRTYAMNYIVKGGKHIGEPFHLKNSRNGNGNDQQYKGYTFEMRSPGTAGSYNQTTGQVIEYNNKPIVAAYSSDSGGVTKSGCEVLSANYCTNEYDYLDGGVKDPATTVHNPSAVAASHGAGMSAAGAYQMATEGSDWQKIIKYYYPGVSIDKYY